VKSAANSSARVTSKDTTAIAYSRVGSGPPVIVVDGALCYRKFGMAAQFAAALAPGCSVITYDRRGRGESGDTAPWSVEREVDDLAALIAAAGGSAALFGCSSGAALALEAANRGLPVTRLALYEPPFIVDDARPPVGADFIPGVEAALKAGRRGDAVARFMKLVGMPGFMVAVMPLLPGWSKLKAVAHTLPYDLKIVAQEQRGKPIAEGRYAGVKVATLAIRGGKSPAWMLHGVEAVARAVPGARLVTLPGQTHMVKVAAIAPLLEEFLDGR
jgi:pimeloyl-ACP methyl ester carboxylesterase